MYLGIFQSIPVIAYVVPIKFLLEEFYSNSLKICGSKLGWRNMV